MHESGPSQWGCKTEEGADVVNKNISLGLSKGMVRFLLRKLIGGQNWSF